VIRRHIILLAAVLSLLAACQMVPSKVTAERQIHTIGIISAFPEAVEFSRSGLTVFGNAKSTHPVSDWNINENLLTAFRSVLEPRYAVVTRTEDPRKFRELDQAPLEVGLGAGRTSRRFAEMLGPQAPEVDLWIVVGPSCASAGNYSGSVPCAIAVNRRESVISRQSEWLYVYAMLMAYDGKSRAYLATHQMFQPTGACGPFGDLVNRFEAQGCVPSIDLGPGYSVDNWSSFSGAQIARMRQSLIAALRPAIAYTLRQMNL